MSVYENLKFYKNSKLMKKPISLNFKVRSYNLQLSHFRLFTGKSLGRTLSRGTLCFSSMESSSLSFFSTLKRPLSTGSNINNFKPKGALVEVSACSYQKFLHFALDETKRRTHLLPSPLQVLFGCLENIGIWVCSSFELLQEMCLHFSRRMLKFELSVFFVLSCH